jgi:hypothetical protein
MADQNGGVFNNPHSYSVNSYSEVAKVDKRVEGIRDVVQYIIDTNTDASDVNFIPSVTITSTNVQDAIDFIDSSSTYGPVTSTTNAISRFANTSGQEFKDSTVIVSDVGDVSMNSQTLITGISPSNPSAGAISVYAKPDNQLYYRTSFGIETRLGGCGNSTPWTFSTLISGIPPVGYLRTNNVIPASITQLAFSTMNENADDIRLLLSTLAFGDQVFLCNRDMSNCKFFTISDSIDNLTWFNITVTIESQSNAANFTQDERVGVTFYIQNNIFDQLLNTTNDVAFNTSSLANGLVLNESVTPYEPSATQKTLYVKSDDNLYLRDENGVDLLVTKPVSTLKEVYDASTPARITTTDASGGLEIRRGTTTGGDDASVLSVLNGAGTTTFEVDGLGNIVAYDALVSGLTILNTTPQIFLQDSNNTVSTASHEIIMVDSANAPCASLKYGSGAVALENSNSGDIVLLTSGSGVVRPNATVVTDFGESTKRWKDGYFGGIVSGSVFEASSDITCLSSSPLFHLQDTDAITPASATGIISFTDNLNAVAALIQVTGGDMYITKPVGNVQVVADSMIVGCPIAMGANKITSTYVPVVDGDLVNKLYVDNAISTQTLQDVYDNSASPVTIAGASPTLTITRTTGSNSGITLKNSTGQSVGSLTTFGDNFNLTNAVPGKGIRIVSNNTTGIILDALNSALYPYVGTVSLGTSATPFVDLHTSGTVKTQSLLANTIDAVVGGALKIGEATATVVELAALGVQTEIKGSLVVGQTSNLVGVVSMGTGATDYTLPNTRGTNEQVLTINAAGVSSWAAKVVLTVDDLATSGSTICGKNAGNVGAMLGADNTVFGELAHSVCTSGSNNTAIGASSMELATTGYQNTAIGWRGLYNIAQGYRNTSVGVLSGFDIVTGFDNICIGMSSSAGSADSQNRIVIGADAIGTTNNECVIGNAALDTIISGANNSCDLGSTARQFKDGHFGGTINCPIIEASSQLKCLAPSPLLRLQDSNNLQASANQDIIFSDSASALCANLSYSSGSVTLENSFSGGDILLGTNNGHVIPLISQASDLGIATNKWRNGLFSGTVTGGHLRSEINDPTITLKDIGNVKTSAQQSIVMTDNTDAACAYILSDAGKLTIANTTAGGDLELNITGDMLPTTTNVVSLGASTHRFKDAILGGDLKVSGQVEIRDYFNVSCAAIYCDTGDLVILNQQSGADIILGAGAVIPNISMTSDLGTSTSKWRDVTCSGTVLGGALNCEDINPQVTLKDTSNPQATASQGIVMVDNNDAICAGLVHNSGVVILRNNTFNGDIELDLTGNLIPTNNNFVSLGTSASKWKNITCSGTVLGGALNCEDINPQVTLKDTSNPQATASQGIVMLDNNDAVCAGLVHDSGVVILRNNTFLGDIELDLTGSLIPTNNNFVSLGSTTKRYKDLFLSGSVYSPTGIVNDLTVESTISLGVAE